MKCVPGSLRLGTCLIKIWDGYAALSKLSDTITLRLSPGSPDYT